jgi:hypothetical protein
MFFSVPFEDSLENKEQVDQEEAMPNLLAKIHDFLARDYAIYHEQELSERDEMSAHEKHIAAVTAKGLVCAASATLLAYDSFKSYTEAKAGIQTALQSNQKLRAILSLYQPSTRKVLRSILDYAAWETLENVTPSLYDDILKIAVENNQQLRPKECKEIRNYLERHKNGSAE